MNTPADSSVTLTAKLRWRPRARIASTPAAVALWPASVSVSTSTLKRAFGGFGAGGGLGTGFGFGFGGGVVGFVTVRRRFATRHSARPLPMHAATR